MPVGLVVTKDAPGAKPMSDNVAKASERRAEAARRTYQTPTLTLLGWVAELTGGGGARYPDALGNKG
jgi:hypothetical protein